MSYKALYRTYRPTTFDEVAGQQHIVKTLKNALKTGKLAHAYLFTGPRGTGKTTMAKLLAKALNCEEGIGHECGSCKNCKAIIDGTHPDVLELDAASNNSVEDIRDLIDKVKYGTILGRYKVYIIDEVHMLSTGAFNALLKTLEEPPEHVIFILATTEPHKIIPTILSRCQRYDFNRLSDEEIKNRLKVVLQEEGIEYNETAINLVVSLADGGMRDALSILDQVLRYSNDQLNEEDIMNVFAIESTQEKIAFITSIISSDSKDVLERLNKYISKGSDIKRLTDDLLQIYKDILIYKTSANDQFLTVLNDEQAYDLSSQISEDNIMKMIESLLNAQKDYKNVPSVNSLFQITVLQMTTICKIRKTIENQPTYIETNIKPVVETVTQIKEAVIEPPSDEENEVSDEPETVTQPQEILQEPIQEEVKENPTIVSTEEVISNPENVIYIKGCLKEGGFFIDDDTMLNIMVTSKKDIKNDLNSKWIEIRKFIAHPEFGKAAGMLCDGHILVASKQVIVLEFGLKKSAERMNEFAMQKQIQAVLKATFGEQTFVYSVDRNDSIRLQHNYLNKMQIGTLPKANQVTLETEVIS